MNKNVICITERERTPKERERKLGEAKRCVDIFNTG